MIYEPENEATTKSQIMDEINSTTEKGAQKRGIDWTIIIVVVIIFIVVACINPLTSACK